MSFWKKGSGEVFGFLCVSPIMVILLMLLVSIVQMTSLKQKLEYTAYVACRAAVVSETLSKAKQAAKEVAEADLRSYSSDYEGNVTVKLEYPTGSATRWEKGNYIQCTVAVKVNPAGIGLDLGRVKSRIIMAIEKPDESQGRDFDDD